LLSGPTVSSFFLAARLAEGADAAKSGETGGGGKKDPWHGIVPLSPSLSFRGRRIVQIRESIARPCRFVRQVSREGFSPFFFFPAFDVGQPQWSRPAKIGRSDARERASPFLSNRGSAVGSAWSSTPRNPLFLSFPGSAADAMLHAHNGQPEREPPFFFFSPVPVGVLAPWRACGRQTRSPRSPGSFFLKPPSAQVSQQSGMGRSPSPFRSGVAKK